MLNVTQIICSKTNPEFGEIVDPTPYFYLIGKPEKTVFIPRTSKFPTPCDIMHIMDNQYTGMHYGYDDVDNLVALISKFNSKMCSCYWSGLH